MRLNKRTASRGAFLLVLGLVGSLLVIIPGSADEASYAEGSAYGVRSNTGKVEVPQVTSVVPPLSSNHQEKEGLSTAVVEVARVESDACINSGTPARLQRRMDTAKSLANGGSAAPEPARQTVKTPPGFPSNSRCFVPTTGVSTVNCENFTGGTGSCNATTPLWNARGFARAINLANSLVTDIEAEAVARCVGKDVTFGTGAAFAISGRLQADPSQPNQQLDPLALGLASSAVVTFWETNWDPATGQTTDGSDTVFVNGLHIKTPEEDIIISHAEATAECPQPVPVTDASATPVPVPEGGFPRDVSLTASKNLVTFGNTFSLTGAVTPATDFETPNYCIANVPVTIQRAEVGDEGNYEDVGTVQTDSSGTFGFNATAEGNAQWLAFIGKDVPKDCAQSASEPVPVNVRPLVKLKVSDKFVRRGRNVRFTAQIIPCEGHQGSNIKLRREFQGRSVKIATEQFNEECKAFFIVKADFKRAVFDVAWARQDDDHQNGKSRAKVVTTFRKRR